jgi:glycine/D-amino acid oxidase-like deaminating enzyme
VAIDTPARLAVLGAGPVGLEAALYARFLGYDVVVYERGEVADAVRQAGDTPLKKPFKDHRTTLGLAAIQAQDESYQAPQGDALLTCREWRERYLLPLSATDLLADHLRLQTTVTGIRSTAEEEFLVQAVPLQRAESVETFDGILDCTGLIPNQDWWQSTSPSEYVHCLGSKQAGSADFQLAAAYDQIRDAFKIIGDREGLDLYSSIKPLLR